MKFTIKKIPSNPRLAPVLRELLENQYSAKKIKQAIEQGRVTLNGKIEQFASRQVRPGDTIVVNLQGFASSAAPKSKVTTIYEDDDILVLNKPPTISVDNNGLLDLLKSQYASLQLVHRLDKETSGVLLLAKTDRAATNLTDQFRDRTVKKEYLAIVDGEIKSPRGHIENYLEKKKNKLGQLTTVISTSKKGKIAITDWEKLESKEQVTLVRCFPLTGRTHQIRVHLASIGHPILGDKRYGQKWKSKQIPQRCLLHAASLTFLHPVTKEKVTYTAPVPIDFKQFISLKNLD